MSEVSKSPNGVLNGTGVAHAPWQVASNGGLSASGSCAI